ncbi:predicted protein [Verticillium alfalfae VaMs.102]|uniref:Predicted protein n=1 Tax=Verticillium alfalfae (strain VaMs.102 / ATCC MYA-4576 / FGSC 10136) TaxID=526221 RepID=C9SDE4_VERA1|nr:predicted protein [Verticillium alfalfae VaMs.102]EEY17096.1 predicted protein [Verticillium alfalfae VaMs.102]
MEANGPYCCPTGCGDLCEDCDWSIASSTKRNLDRSSTVHQDSVFEDPATSVCSASEAGCQTHDRSYLHVRGADDIIPKDKTREFTDPLTWPEGEKDWWEKMNAIQQTRGLWYYHWIEPGPNGRRIVHADSNAQVYSLDEDDQGDSPWRLNDPQAGGTQPVTCCTIVVFASNLGLVLAHFWEVPTFVAMNPGTGNHDPERQAAGYQTNVIDFLKYGKAYPVSPLVQKGGRQDPPPVSPPIVDLFKPGMILDKASVLWRSIVVFSPRANYWVDDEPVRKNLKAMTQFKTDLASFCGVDEEEIESYTLYATGEDNDDGSPAFRYNLYDRFFTWRYKTYWGNNDEGKWVKRKRFRGMWEWQDYPDSARCNLEIRTFANPTDDEGKNYLNVVVRPWRTKGAGNDGDGEIRLMRYELDGQHDEGIPIGSQDFEEDVTLIYKPDDSWRTNPDKRPDYDTWHPNVRFGDHLYEYKGDATPRGSGYLPKCRGGSWKRPEKDGKIESGTWLLVQADEQVVIGPRAKHFFWSTLLTGACRVENPLGV